MRTRMNAALLCLSISLPFFAATTAGANEDAGSSTIAAVTSPVASVSTQPPAAIRSKASRKSELGTCVDRGVHYFQTIDTFPELSLAPNTGRDAREVAEEKCRRSLRAFAGF